LEDVVHQLIFEIIKEEYKKYAPQKTITDFLGDYEFIDCDFNLLKSLDLSKNTALKHVTCYGNQLTSLDVSRNSALEVLVCGGNRLKSLDVSNNIALNALYCYENLLTSLDISKNEALTSLNCSYNQLTNLDVSNHTAMAKLLCNANQLKLLDISKVPALSELVKNVEPVEEDSSLVWKIDEDGDGETDKQLEVDKNVSIVRDQAEKIDIVEAKMKTIKDQTYNGKAIKPKVTLEYEGKKLVLETDYTVDYKNNKRIGVATVIVTGVGDYTGTKEANFYVVPDGVKISTLKAGSKRLTVKWKKGKSITGYELEYSLKKDFKNSQTVIISKAAITETVIKKLSAKKTYYFRIRTYKTVNGKNYYSKWSTVKSKKTK